MKFLSLLAGFGLSLGLGTMANAKIVNGTTDGYFTRMYATDLTGNHFPQFDGVCQSNAWMLVNTYFYSDWRVNTDSNVQAAFFTYGNMEHLMTGTSNNGYYVFKTDQLSPSLKNLHGHHLSLSLDVNFKYASAQLVFEPVQVPVQNQNISYQCVLSTP